MADTYSCAARSTLTTSGSAVWEFRTGTADRARVYEVGVFLTNAVGSVFGLGVAAARSTTGQTFVSGSTESGISPAATSVLVTNFTNTPVSPTIFNRRVALAAQTGAGVIWSFPRGYLMEVNASLVLWNLSANTTVDTYIVWDE